MTGSERQHIQGEHAQNSDEGEQTAHGFPLLLADEQFAPAGIELPAL